MADELVPKKKDRAIIINREDVRQSGGDGFGLALVGAAKESYDEIRKQRALAAVMRLMAVRDRALAMIVRWKEVSDFNQEKIDALEAGKFEYELATGLLSFEDERLNIEWETPKGIK